MRRFPLLNEHTQLHIAFSNTNILELLRSDTLFLYLKIQLNFYLCCIKPAHISTLVYPFCWDLIEILLQAVRDHIRFSVFFLSTFCYANLLCAFVAYICNRLRLHLHLKLQFFCREV